MKCLSVSQPFAELIISGNKTIELRTWNTNFRGEFLIHAPIKIRTEDCKRLKITKQLKTGAIVGKAEIYEVKPYKNTSEINGTLFTGELELRRFPLILTLELTVSSTIP